MRKLHRRGRLCHTILLYVSTSRLVHQWLCGVLINVGVADLFVAVGLNIRLTMAELLFGVSHRILCFAVSFLYFTFGLLAHPFQLLFLAIGRLAEFLLRLSDDVLQFAFNLV